MQEFTQLLGPYEMFITDEQPYGDSYLGQAYVVKAFGLANDLFDVKVTTPQGTQTTVTWQADVNGIVIQPVDAGTPLGLYKFTAIRRSGEPAFQTLTPVYLNLK